MAKANVVFTPTDTPTITYVDRAERKFEQALRTGMEIPKMVVSVSGPSKSGKSVLINRVVDKDNLITVPGVSIKTGDDLWDRILDWMGAPLEETASTNSGFSTGASAKGEAGFSLGVKATGGGSLTSTYDSKSGSSEKRARGGIQQVAKEIAGSDFVVLIEDFHYIAKDVQEEVGRQIKSGAEAGIKFITASVPHRSDDVVRSNPELRGRVYAVDLAYWETSELRQIARKGFTALGVDIAPSVETALADEAFGSPQLMQAICLNFCLSSLVSETLPEQRRIDADQERLDAIFEQTSVMTDYTTLVEALHGGPKQRGTERKPFSLVDGSTGDVYRTVMLAMCSDPPVLSFRYDQMLTRVRGVCSNESPVGSSISEALVQMGRIANIQSPSARVLEWDDDVLDIVEPYFLFFLRNSSKIRALGAG